VLKGYFMNEKRRLLVLGHLLGLALVSGCDRKIDISGTRPKIAKTHTLTWKCDFAARTWVDVNAYLFPVGPQFEEFYKQKRIFRDELIKRARQMQYTAPTQKLRRSYMEELEGYEKDETNYVGSWPNWPLVMIMQVLLEHETPTKVTVICRCGVRPADIVFTMECPDKIKHVHFLRTLKEITPGFEVMNDVEWSQLPMASKPLFTGDAESIPKKMADFLKDSVFIKQR